MKDSNILKISNLSKSFGKKKILKCINVEMNDGIYGLIGSNGSGKTTLIRCLLNYYKYEGVITLNGTLSKKLSAREIGYLPQKFSGYPSLTVKQMLEYFCNIKGLPAVDTPAQVENALNLTNLTEYKDNKVKHLSGGMLRRLGIAQALVGDTKVIILDEPTSGLDPEERNRFKQVIDNIKEGRIIILTSHIVDDIDACCDRTIVLKKGQVIFCDDTNRLKDVACGFIREIPYESLPEKGDFEVEKIYMKDDVKYCRIILNEKSDDFVAPTLEDGYLKLITDSNT